MLTLLIGDLHIPEREIEIPPKFRKLLAPHPNQVPANNKISKVLCLGNITNSFETLKFIANLSPSFHAVRGEFDDSVILSQQLASINKTARGTTNSSNDNNVKSATTSLSGSTTSIGANSQLGSASIPFHQTIAHDNLRIGFTNGYQVVPRNDPLSLLTLARELDVDILVWGGTHKVEAYTLDGKFFINPGSATGAYSFDWPDNEEDGDEEDAVSVEDNEAEVVQDEPAKEKVDSEEANGDAGEKKDESNTNTDASASGDENADKSSQNGHEATETAGAGDKGSEGAQREEEVLDEELLDEINELSSSIPSFCLLDTHASKCTSYIYTYINDEVKVDKVTYQKE